MRTHIGNRTTKNYLTLVEVNSPEFFFFFGRTPNEQEENLKVVRHFVVGLGEICDKKWDIYPHGIDAGNVGNPWKVELLDFVLRMDEDDDVREIYSSQKEDLAKEQDRRILSDNLIRKNPIYNFAWNADYDSSSSEEEDEEKTEEKVNFIVIAMNNHLSILPPFDERRN